MDRFIHPKSTTTDNSVFAVRGVYPAESGAHPNAFGTLQTHNTLYEIALKMRD